MLYLVCELLSIGQAQRTTATDSAQGAVHLARSGRVFEARDKVAREQVEAIDHHENKNLERQRNHHGGKHHHTHCHENRANHHINRQKRQVEQESNLKRRFDFANHKRGQGDENRNVIDRLGRFHVADSVEQAEVFLARVVNHEILERLRGDLERDIIANLSVEIGADSLFVALLGDWLHDEKCQHHCERDNELRGWGLLRSHRGAQKREHNHDAREARHHQDERGREHQECEHGNNVEVPK